MKTFIMALGLLITLTSFGKEIDCTNQSLYWQEDSLYLNFETMSGSYFDNDTSRDLECFKSEISEEEGYVYCHEDGDATSLATRVDPNGKATIIYSVDQWIDFSCDI